ncbi:transcription termination factor 4, mitochondrial-like [Clavelina lepadiformis]|uniref:Transcription termination factor 4, mitochondrial n=1 Tax=Clavelina lepadiformis TaxID=159417 RepID=A0ABP0H421_CLALP
MLKGNMHLIQPNCIFKLYTVIVENCCRKSFVPTAVSQTFNYTSLKVLYCTSSHTDSKKTPSQKDNNEQAGTVVDKVCKTKEVPHLTRSNFIKSYLKNDVGLSQKTIRLLEEKCQEMHEHDLPQLRHLTQTLSSYKFSTNQINRLVYFFPGVVFLSGHKVSRLLESVLAETGLKSTELHELVIKAPNILLDGIAVTKEKYLFFDLIMGIKDSWCIVESGAMKYSLYYLQERHDFLWRRGQYIKPDRHGSTRIENPSLKDIFCTTTSDFCDKVALCEIREYQLFQELYVAESKLFRQDEKLNADDDDLEEEEIVPSKLAEELFKSIKK